MSKLLKPQAPPPPAVVQLPSPISEDPAAKKQAQDAMDAAAAEQRRVRGRASTILTGPMGLEKSPGVVSKMILSN